MQPSRSSSAAPLLVSAELPRTPDEDAAVLDSLTTALASTSDVEAVAPPLVNEAGDTAVISVIPVASPQDERTEDLVHTLRDDVLPAATDGTGATTYVGGPTAVSIDLADKLAQRLPVFMAGVIGLSFILLMMEFRSLFEPAKAALMNLLSIGAAYGAAVAVFQWGWLSGLLGTSTGPIESFAPMMLFAVLFGLSMNYEVFLLSRVREEYERAGDNSASMDLAGRANWWMPRWLDRILPRLEPESTEPPGASAPTTGDARAADERPKVGA